MTTMGVAVVGAGYWGPNLIRNFFANPDWDLRWVVDLDEERARNVTRSAPGVRITSDLNDVLDDPEVVAVAVATPAATHTAIVLACLEAGTPRAGREAAGSIVGRRPEAGHRRRRAGSDAHVRPHLLLHAGGAQDPRARPVGPHRRRPVLRLGSSQPRPGPARHRRPVGPRTARPVDPRLHPAGGHAADGRSPPSGPIRSVPVTCASATSPCRSAATPWPTCT